MQNVQIISVGIAVPLYQLFDYLSSEPVEVGDRVLVSFARKTVVGIVLDLPTSSTVPAEKLKHILEKISDIPPIQADTLALIHFLARYYQQPLGMVAHMALPKALRSAQSYKVTPKRQLPSKSILNALHKIQHQDFGLLPSKSKKNSPPHTLNTLQQQAIAQIEIIGSSKPILLHGVTGSGKTEVYLEVMRRVLANQQQILLLVPEINLTPQLIKNVAQNLFRSDALAPVAQLHSHLTDNQRLQNWLAIHENKARVIVGTRLSVFAPFQNLGLIIIDEEHDPSYRQQDNTRYSARDMAIWLAKQKNIPIILGSATPALESWNNAQQNRYALISMPERATPQVMPETVLIPMDESATKTGISQPAHTLIAETLQQQKQVLIFMNRRGFSPVLYCPSCTWKSACNHCSSFMVLHKNGSKYQLRCHHCASFQFIPPHCPTCQNTDLQPMGIGTQRLEDVISEQYPNTKIVRIDADSTAKKGSAEQLFADIHNDQAQIIIGTQMIAKGHDFKNVALVVVVNADNSLYSYNFRATEYLFAQLMQVSGRAGRGFTGAKVLIQTIVPEHIVYQALQSHRYEVFAQHELTERQLAQLPPFSYQAILRAEARDIQDAFQFLHSIRNQLLSIKLPKEVQVSPPMAHSLVRVANKERAHILFSSNTRVALSHALQHAIQLINLLSNKKGIAWFVDVDPIEGIV